MTTRDAQRDFKLPDAGECIYCGAVGKLSDEHIVPLSLGGNAILPRASCPVCQAAINRFEAPLATATYGWLRTSHVYPTRRPKARPQEAEVELSWNDGTTRAQSLPVEAVPFQITLLRFPSFLDADPRRTYLQATPTDPEPISKQKWNRILRRFGAATGRVTSGGIRIAHYVQLLAKISAGIVWCADQKAYDRSMFTPRIFTPIADLESIAHLHSEPAEPQVRNLFEVEAFVRTEADRFVLFTRCHLLRSIDSFEHFCRIGPVRQPVHALLTPSGLTHGSPSVAAKRYIDKRFE